MIEFKCPVCAEKLIDNEKSFSCPNGHLFDKARSGYVNLLRNSSSHAHGDDKAMLRSRTDFLGKGYYKPLLDKLAMISRDLISEDSNVLDAGCGEGYYSDEILKICAERSSHFVGIDIAKAAVEKTAKKLKSGSYAVASVYELPFYCDSFDAVYSVFSPLAEAEFARIIKCGGYLIRVYPLEDHLFELKAAVYDEPYKNEEINRIIPQFEEIITEKVDYFFSMESNEDIKNLFSMTPYSHKTSERDIKKLDLLEKLLCRASFGISVYRKK